MGFEVIISGGKWLEENSVFRSKLIVKVLAVTAVTLEGGLYT